MDYITAKYGKQLIDSLPYVDEPLPQYEAQVQTLIEEEMRRFTPSAELMASFPPFEFQLKVTDDWRKNFEKRKHNEITDRWKMDSMFFFLFLTIHLSPFVF
jgi:hypothetical protein